MVYQQLLEALDIGLDERGTGSAMIYPLPDLTRAGIVQRVGTPFQADLGEGGAIVLLYVVEGGRALIVGQENNGVITRGIVFIDT